MKYFNVNGKLVEAAEAMIQITDLAILRGYGVFDFFLVKRGKGLFLDEYLDRFSRSASALDLKLPLSKEQLRNQIGRLIENNGLSEAAIRLVLTGGFAEDGLTPIKPNLLILEHQHPSYPSKYYQEGVKLITHQHQRELPGIKSINYLTGIHLLKKVKAAGAIEALYHDGEHLLESVRSNIFLYTDEEKLVTPGKNVLWGITRKQVLELARDHYQVEEREIVVEELETAREVFITSSTKGVMPIVQVDELCIGEGRPGKVTQHIKSLFTQRQEDYLTEVTV